jgi:type VI secretion system protein ImpM
VTDLQSPIPGWYGKIPSLGDFASRRLPPSFVNEWDAWLQRGLAASREQLGADWLDLYMTSPIWRFALMPGVCGADAWAGVMMPSVDKVGRHFPLTIATPVPSRRDALLCMATAHDWYTAVEQLALCALNLDFTAEDLERDLARDTFPMPATTQPGDDDRAREFAHWWLSLDDYPHVLALPSLRAIAQTVTAAQDQVFATLGEGRSLWWTGPAPDGPAQLCCFTGLPPDSHFAALLQGVATGEAP